MKEKNRRLKARFMCHNKQFIVLVIMRRTENPRKRISNNSCSNEAFVVIRICCAYNDLEGIAMKCNRTKI